MPLGFGGEHGLPGVCEQSGHLRRPTLALGLADGVEFTKVISVAKNVGHVVVLAVWCPAVVDEPTCQVLQDTHSVHGDDPALVVEVVQGELVRRCRVDPLQDGLDPQSGLVGVDYLRSNQEVFDPGQECFQHDRAVFDHGDDRPGGHCGPVGVAEQLGDPGDGDALAGHQVTDIGP